MESQDRTVPAVSRRVGPEVARVLALVVSIGDAWVIATRHASMSMVLGEGEGKGEDGPERWMVLQRGVVDGLGEAFSS